MVGVAEFLRAPDLGAVLVEIGFGTNPKDAAFISDPGKQDALASAIADAAMQYLDGYDDRVKAGKDPKAAASTGAARAARGGAPR